MYTILARLDLCFASLNKALIYLHNVANAGTKWKISTCSWYCQLITVSEMTPWPQSIRIIYGLLYIWINPLTPGDMAMQHLVMAWYWLAAKPYIDIGWSNRWKADWKWDLFLDMLDIFMTLPMHLFSNVFSLMKPWIFNKISLKYVPYDLIDEWFGIGSGNGLASICRLSRPAIIWTSDVLVYWCWYIYPKTSNIRHTLVGNKIVDNSDVVGTSPVGPAPITSSFST